MKPSVIPFAVVGMRHRSFWIGLLLSLPPACWFSTCGDKYAIAIGNADAEWWYSLEDTPPYFAAIVAWLGRRDGGFASPASCWPGGRAASGLDLPGGRPVPVPRR
jgi:hypothetical protein